MSDLCTACSKVVGRRQHAVNLMPVTVGSIVFARQVIQISFISYLEANIYLFI